MKPGQIRAKGRYETGETIQEKVQLYRVQTEYDFMSSGPIFISCIQNRVSVRKQAGRKYIKELRDPCQY